MMQKENVDEMVKIGLNSGFQFALTMIKEMHTLNEKSLLNSL